MKMRSGAWMLGLFVGLGLVAPAEALPTVYIEPEVSTVDSGEVFDVQVMVSAEADTMSNFSIEFTYNHRVLEFVTALEGSLYLNCGYGTLFRVEEVESLNAWRVWDVILYGLGYVVAPGELCRLRFRAIDLGYSPIELLSVSLKDIGRYPIEPLEWRHGSVCVGDQAGLPGGTFQPSGFRLGLPWPNPARGSLSIPVLSDRADPGTGSVSVFDAAGRLVAKFKFRPSSAAVVWDTRDSGGSTVQPGIYFLRVSVRKEVATRSVVVVP